MKEEKAQNHHFFLRNLAVWSFIYALWFLWESMIRVLINHRDWNAWQILHYTATNVLYGLVWSFVLGTCHGLLLKTRLRKYLLPTIAMSLSMLLAVPVLFYFRDLIIGTDMPMVLRWILSALIVLVIYAGFVFLFTRRAFVISRGSQRILTTVLVAVPIAVLFFFSFQNRKPLDIATGRIRYVVLISIDTLRYDYVGAYNPNNAKTPVMNQVAAEGVLFRNAIASIAYTGPSHATMFTGQSPLIHGVLFNGTPLSSKVTTVTTRLREAGFRTAGFISGYPMKRINSGLDSGFQVYDENLSWIDFFNETYYGRMILRVPFFTLGIWQQAKPVTDRVLSWLEKNSDRPFFLFVHYYDPHYPYGKKSDPSYSRNPFQIRTKPEDIENQKRLYTQEVESVDAQIGRIIEFLKRNGIYDQTLLLITSDHGEGLGDHGLYYDHSTYVYDELMRVPLMLRCPALVKAGTVIEQQVALMDIHKTILGATGLKPGSDAGGFNLLEIIQNPSLISDRTILSHCFLNSKHKHGLRTQRWKLIKIADDTRYELFDLQSDPGETRNLYDNNRDTVIALKGSLERLVFSFENGAKPSPQELSAEQIERLKSLGYLN